jgi:hypothetical protein
MMQSLLTEEEALKKYETGVIGEYQSTAFQPKDIFDRGELIYPNDTHLDPDLRGFVDYLESRLAQFGFLAEDQANGIYGSSTDEALDLMREAYGIDKPMFPGVSPVDLQAIITGTKSAESLKKKQSTYQALKWEVKARGKAWDDNAGIRNIVGIRGFLLGKGKVENVHNIYNDVLFACWVDTDGTEHAIPFRASLDPGYYYTHVRPLNAQGAAHLVSGQYIYQWGRHGKRQYPALVQAQSVTVARSFRGDIRDTDVRDIGWFGIHFHAGSTAAYVYNASAGCQVIYCGGSRSAQYRYFLEVLGGYKQNQMKFRYTLFDGLRNPETEMILVGGR